MSNSYLQQLIASGESERLEFKEQAPEVNVIGRVVCSFLNTMGGTLVIGVNTRGEVVGVKSAEAVAERLRESLPERISPRAPWSVNTDVIDGKNLVMVDVPKGRETPYVFENAIFVRHGGATLAATREDIASLIDQRHAEGTRWERLPALGFNIEDLDKDEILLAATEAQQNRLYRFNNPNDPLSILEQLGVASQGLLLNSAVVLFGLTSALRFPQIRVRAARFEGFEKSISFADNRVLEGHAFLLIAQMEQFVRSHIAIESRPPRGGVRRSDVPVYPFPALREAMLNAIVHRDYAAFDGGISVAIYDDRIEFWNSGSLPEGMTVDNLKRPHASRPHNPDIANVFFLRGLIERWGIGTGQIVTLCTDAGLPEPQWTTDGGGVTLTLSLEPQGKEIKLNDRQITLLNQLKPGDSVKPSLYFEAVSDKVKERRARTDINELVDAGFLRREGRGPSTVYIRTRKRS
jgi:ATP-dependent DNA helicase RecG